MDFPSGCQTLIWQILSLLHHLFFEIVFLKLSILFHPSECVFQVRANMHKSPDLQCLSTASPQHQLNGHHVQNSSPLYICAVQSNPTVPHFQWCCIKYNITLVIIWFINLLPYIRYHIYLQMECFIIFRWPVVSLRFCRMFPFFICQVGSN